MYIGIYYIAMYMYSNDNHANIDISNKVNDDIF